MRNWKGLGMEGEGAEKGEGVEKVEWGRKGGWEEEEGNI